MKKIILITVLALAILLTSPNALAITKFAYVSVNLINQEPDPVAPGNAFDVRFRLQNNGSDPAKDMQVKLVLNYPFSAYGSEPLEKNIGTLVFNARTGEDIGVVEKWRLYADPNAATGNNKIELWYKTGTGSWTKAGEYDISVRSKSAFLAINSIKSIPEKIVPGTTTKVSFILENTANNDLRDVNLNLGIYAAVATASGVSVTELPITPIGSGNEKTIAIIAKGSKQEIYFDLFTDANAGSKVYKVPFTLTYHDASGSNYTRTGVVGLVVESTPELAVYVDESEVLSAGQSGRVSVKFVNKGFSDIKFLDTRLNEGSEFSILSTPEVYIGDLDSDDYETAEYTIGADKAASGKIILPITIDYRDANGNLYNKQLQLPMTLFTKEQLKQKNGKNNSTAWIWTVIIVVAIIAFIAYRKYKRSKRK